MIFQSDLIVSDFKHVLYPVFFQWLRYNRIFFVQHASAAFNTIDHSIPIDRLSAGFGIFGLALDCFSSYLANRSSLSKY